MSDFSLHPRLKSDCHYVGKMELSHVLLLNNNYFRWFLLVPEVTESQVHKLTMPQRALLHAETHYLSCCVEEAFRPLRINTGAIGNIVPQLHVHVVARSENDPAWPGVVWGCPESRPYDPSEADSIIDMMQAMLRDFDPKQH